MKMKIKNNDNPLVYEQLNDFSFNILKDKTVYLYFLDYKSHHPKMHR